MIEETASASDISAELPPCPSILGILAFGRKSSTFKPPCSFLVGALRDDGSGSFLVTFSVFLGAAADLGGAADFGGAADLGGAGSAGGTDRLLTAGCEGALARLEG